jgi:hypothetical protein
MGNEIVILTGEGDGGGDMHGKPSPEEARDVILVKGVDKCRRHEEIVIGYRA